MESTGLIKEFGLTEVDLNDLPRYSEWPERIMGIKSWTTRQRTELLVKNEYGGKWMALEGVLHEFKGTSFDELVDRMFERERSTHQLVHLGERVFRIDNNVRVWELLYRKIFPLLKQYVTPDTTLVELGCGWARNLFFALNAKLGARGIGGEFTPEGVRLGNAVAGRFGFPVDVFPFDFYNADLGFIDECDDVVIFTHNSIEQISELPEQAVYRILDVRPRAVLHFEPVYEYRNEPTLFHCMSKRYTEINDYNRNLLTILRKLENRGILEIVHEEIHSLGINAFNPGSSIVWRPK